MQEKTYSIPAKTLPGSIGRVTQPPCGCRKDLMFVLSVATTIVRCDSCKTKMSSRVELLPGGGKVTLMLSPGAQPPESANVPAPLKPALPASSAHAEPPKETSKSESEENPLQKIDPLGGYYSDREFHEDMGHFDPAESSDS